MNIIVTLKQVADPSVPPHHIQLDPGGKRITSPFGVPPVINGYDANALEEALQLREKLGGKVTALGLGDNSSRESLKRAIAMGADSAILINDPALIEADSASVGKALAAAIRKIGAFDLILSGRQASDTDGGQVLHWVAHALGIPSISPVSRIESADEEQLVVHRLVEEGHQRLRVKLPALIAVSSEINEPRFPPTRGTMAAARAMIPGWKTENIGLPPQTAKVELRKLEIQHRATKAQLIAGADPAEQGKALADKLNELGLI